jgi:hypothetical protein
MRTDATSLATTVLTPLAHDAPWSPPMLRTFPTTHQCLRLPTP